MASYAEILDGFVNLIVKGNDFSAGGVEIAFAEFCKSLKEIEHKPIPAVNDRSGYVKTTLKEAVEAAKLPVYIVASKNSQGNMEWELYPGLVIKPDPDKPDSWIAHGLQDGPSIAPLTMNAVLVCQANGVKYDGKNLSGSAKMTSTPLRV